MKKLILIIILLIAGTLQAQYYGNSYANKAYMTYLDVDTVVSVITFQEDVHFLKDINTDTITVDGVINNGLVYGSVYIADDYPDTIIVGATDQYYCVGAVVGANGKNWTSGGVLKNVTVRDSFITVQKAGKYEVSYSFSFQTITGVTNGLYNFYVFVNDVKQEKTGAKRLMSGTDDLGVGAVAPTVLELAANDEIKLKILSPTDNSNTVCFQYAIIHVKKIDN